jgi:hypothetical protein
MRQVWSDGKAGFVSGFMTTVPAEWQQKLGGPAATGQCCIPIAWRTSWGPSAFAFNPLDLLTAAKVPATPLVYYSDEHQTLGPWKGNNTVYSAATEITGMAFIAGSRTALYFGRTGTGAFCYGEGLSDPHDARIGQQVPEAPGETYCYDPTNSSKGQHGYPYNYQIWAYDMNDLAAVKAGAKQPWEVRPYGVWPFTLPINATQIRLGGIGYDASRQIIYISQIYGDQDTYDNRPLIHALKVGGAAGAPMPAPDTTPLPDVGTTGSASPDGARLTALALVANKPAPQPAATTITFTATPTGGVTPHEYKWLVHDGLKWNLMVNWSAANTFNWTPTAASSQYRVGVWVRSAGNSSDVAEFTQSADFAIGNSSSYTSPYEAAKAVALTANRTEPQPAGSMITWTATPSGGQAPHQYKWLVHNGLQWNVVMDWSTSSTFVWTPAIGNSQYRIGVWVRSARGTGDVAEASNSADFAISGSSSTPPPGPTTPPPGPTPGPSTSARIIGLALSANRPAPQPSGTTITFSAMPTGGAAPHQYKWLVHDGLRWNEMGGWSTANTFNWTPAAKNSQYRIGVWVRGAGNTSDIAEFTQSVDYAISTGTTAPVVTTPPPTSPPPTSPTTGRIIALSLTANRVGPQPVNTTTTFTAVPTGGAGPHQYKWLLFDRGQWKVVGDWTTSNTFNWTPETFNPEYRFGVWVRSAGNAADVGEFTSSIDFPIVAAGTSVPVPPPASGSALQLTAVTVAANRVAPQGAGSTITFTATPNGGAAPQQFKWLVHDGMNWTPVTGWSTSTTFDWTPATQNSGYRIGVWVRGAGLTADTPQVTSSFDFPITGVASPPPPPTTSAGRLTSVRLGADKPAPQAVGSTIMFTAIPTGSTQHQYKWLVHNGATWTAVTGWSASSTFSWTPTSANNIYRVGVWVRTGGSVVDAGEMTMSMDFPIKK